LTFGAVNFCQKEGKSAIHCLKIFLFEKINNPAKNEIIKAKKKNVIWVYLLYLIFTL